VGGVEAVRGIGYQHAHAVLTALDVLADENLGAIRVEGVEDVMDIEVHANDGTVVLAKQVKVRSEKYSWGKKALLDVMRAWAALPVAAGASFEFLTDGRLGPSGEEVRRALETAADGNFGQLAALLGEAESSPICEILSRAQVRQEATGVETVLLEAEREVRALLPGARTRADLEEQARQAVDRLYRLLSLRAGAGDDEVRIVSRAEIADVLGGLTYLAEPDRWPGTLRDTYQNVAAGEAEQASVMPRLVPLPGGAEAGGTDDGTLALSQILASSGPVVLAGRTGTGKTTAARLLRREAASKGKTVLVGHAETYVPGRLDSLVADAMSAVVGREFSAVTGRQVLNDPEVLLVIDGVSEIPDVSRMALRDELRVPVATSSGARVLLAGRDVAVLGSVLPTSIAPMRYQLADLGFSQQSELARRSLAGDGELVKVDDHAVHRLASQAQRSLGDAAGNPMLFTMALELVGQGIAFTDRASMYEATVARMAERVGAAGIDVTTAVLGVVFAGLLDEGRRYANPYEWDRLVAEAVERLAGLHVRVDVLTVLDAAQRTGVVTPIGHTQTLAPVHDSFADYLAGAAHARKLVPLPEQLHADDEQRALFAAEVGGVTAELAELAARDLPFITVVMANHDERQLGDGAPDEVTALLGFLAPVDECRAARLWRDGERVVASLVDDVPGWVDPEEGRALVRFCRTAVCGPGEGPLAVAVRLWRLILLDCLEQPREMRPSHVDSLEEARDALERHARAEMVALGKLVRSIAPPGKDGVLASAIGPFGLTAIVSRAEQGTRGAHWPVTSRHTAGVFVHSGAGKGPLDAHLERSGHSSVDYLIRLTPAESAAVRTRAAINTMTTGRWL
jgi:hypothetical protein